MSDDPPDPLPPLRPLPVPRGWRERLTTYAESFDLTPARLVAGVGLVVAVLAAGWWLMRSPGPPPEARLPIVTTPSTRADAAPQGSVSTARPAEVVVHVAGAVTSPGVQRLDAAARVVDAIDAAGGAQPNADLGRVNLAAVLEDGQQVYVPQVGEPGGGAAAGTAGESGPVPINTATVVELETLPGIGPSLAEAIVDYRSEHGPFGSVEDLLNVRGIGRSKLDALRDQVAVL